MKVLLYKGDFKDLAKTIELNQPMSGRFLEWNGEKYVANITHYVGESVTVNNLGVVINGTTYQVNSDGKFSLIYTFSKDDEIYKS